MWRLVAQIPRGSVATYGDLAAALGSRTAARWVGQELAHHECGARCRCHRVVLAGGALGNYAAGPARAKQLLLTGEGVVFEQERVAVRTPRFVAFTGPQPLAKLQTEQTDVAAKVRLTKLAGTIHTVAALDVSYARAVNGDELGVAAYVLTNATGEEILWSTTVVLPVSFPYLSGFLTFREAPLLAAAWEAARAAGRLADVYLIDGSGVLHPRHAGSATHFGVTHDLATIGVTKHRLCGKLVASGDGVLGKTAATAAVPIEFGGRRQGTALAVTTNGRLAVAQKKQWLYVSPGHRVGVRQAGEIVARCVQRRRLPEPIYWADRLSRQRARALSADVKPWS